MTMSEIKSFFISDCCKVIDGLHESSIVFGISEEVRNNKGRTLIICKDNSQASEVATQLRFFSGLSDKEIILVPEIEILPYDTESPNEALLSERNNSLNKLFKSSVKDDVFVITTAFSASQKIMAENYWKKSVATINEGEKISPSSLTEKLKSIGFSKAGVEIVNNGQYIHTGNVVDFFPVNYENPVRVIFENDTVSGIFLFHVKDQKSFSMAQDVEILPFREVPYEHDYSLAFRKNFRKVFSEALKNPIYNAVSNSILPDGIEFYISLYGDCTTIFSEFNSSEQNVFFVEDFDSTYISKLNFAQERYLELMRGKDRKILPPDDVWVPLNICFTGDSKPSIYSLTSKRSSDSKYHIEETKFSKKHSIPEVIGMLSEPFSNAEKIILAAISSERIEQLKPILSILGVTHEVVTSWEMGKASNSKAVITYSDIKNGFYDVDNKVLLITEYEIFGTQIKIYEDIDDDVSDDGNVLRNLNINDLVVHHRYGIGKYKGLKKPVLSKSTPEFITIEYADQMVNYVPLHEMNLIRKYQTLNADTVQLTKFDKDGKGWRNDLYEMIDEIQGVSQELFQDMTKRQSLSGVSIPSPTPEYFRFCKEFPYLPTKDQLRAARDIEEDLKSVKPMNRVIAGDVGFGKTEIAQRAAMLCGIHKYQVIVVAPSTILCHQHYLSFKERFSGFNVNICEFSSNTDKDDSELLQGIKSGTIDIIVSTNKIFKRDLKFKNLGLVIIDEEHRFGVDDKDRFKHAFPGINMMYMTATPIPRTLGMSLSGIKDTSTLSTAPASRLSIVTKIEDLNVGVVKESISRELMRNGQIFYVHNKVATIYDRAKSLKEIFPDLRIAVIHGRLSSVETEEIMAKFHQKAFDLLLATTIIENGIDVPNANTILIENADHFGLAALHQLRGRVGRSSRQGYCILLKSGKNISTDGISRLNAMKEASKLGEGYRLANYDMEIRGAGEILGEGQSGCIHKMGFDMYHSILSKSMNFIKEHPMHTLQEYHKQILRDGDESCKVEIGIPFEIDESYIPYDGIRIFYYSKIFSITTQNELDEIFEEMSDRFGKMPQSLMSFYNACKIMLMAKKTKVTGVITKDSEGVISLSKTLEDHSIPMAIFMKDEAHMSFSFSDNSPLIKLTNVPVDIKERCQYIEKLLHS